VKTRLSIIASLALSAGMVSPGHAQEETGACLITKTDINPFFVKMKEGATAKAEELGINLSTFAGKVDGDHETQVQAIETCIASGAKGILITASDTKAIVPVVQQARDAGLLVIALDTPLEPIDSADATFATDNFKAGELIGAWAAAQLGINVVYTINEPAAAGAYEALKAFGREDKVMIVSVDGGCPGVQNVAEGVIGATSQQYPLLMASLGVEAIAAWAADGTKPEPTEGLEFFDTGVSLVTDMPVEGVESIDTTEGMDRCWG